MHEIGTASFVRRGAPGLRKELRGGAPSMWPQLLACGPSAGEDGARESISVLSLST